MIVTKVGEWHVREAQELQRNPSSYAADWMTIRTEPGTYEARLAWDLTGFTCPMPKDLLVGVSARILRGKLYSGIGGVNYASTDIEPGPYTDTVQLYTYQIAQAAESGVLTLDPGWEWLTLPDHGYIPYARDHWTRDMVLERRVA